MSIRALRVLFRVSTPAALVICATLPAGPRSALAQGRRPIGYGVTERFSDAHAKQLLVLGVQQAISDLPPSSGQTFSYEYDTVIDAWVRRSRLGPTSFFAPETIGRGTVDLRFATSYFELGQSFRPIDYQVTDDEGSRLGYTKAGMSVSATVGVFSVAATCGLLGDLDLSLTIPITIVDAHSSISFTTCQAETSDLCGTTPNPPVYDARFIAVVDRARIDAPAFLRGEDPSIFQRSGSASAFAEGGGRVPFEEGTQLGLGRVLIAAKRSFRGWSAFRAAVLAQVAVPSPSQDAYAGSDSTGLMVRAIAAADVAEDARVLADAGYEYDTRFDELSRFVWDLGASYAFARATVDLGVGGSVYAAPIAWTPGRTSTFVEQVGGSITLTALQDNEVGTTYVAVRTGARVRLTESATLSGTVTIPVDDDTFHADAVGTLALDVAF
jgi:hypothetical protein